MVITRNGVEKTYIKKGNVLNQFIAMHRGTADEIKATEIKVIQDKQKKATKEEAINNELNQIENGKNL